MRMQATAMSTSPSGLTRNTVNCRIATSSRWIRARGPRGSSASAIRTISRSGPETLLMYFSGAHWRQPMEFDDDRLAEAAARAAGIREAARGLIDGPSPEWSAPLRERFFDALARDFNTPRALAIVAEWTHRANRSPAGTVGSADLGEMLDVLGLRTLLEARDVEVPERARQLRDAR